MRVIKSFRHKGLQQFFETGSKAGAQSGHAAKLPRQLAVLNRASGPPDMNLPGWALHPLKGSLPEHWSVSVSGDSRLTFKFEQGHAGISPDKALRIERGLGAERGGRAEVWAGMQLDYDLWRAPHGKVA